MINYYQPFLFPFLGKKRYILPKGIKQYYYHSWEDALWDLLNQKNIPKGSTVLLPDFYCMDVVTNIENHGYKTKMYPLDSHFQIKQKKFLRILKKEKPSVIIIFHSCGITSSLTKNTDWTHGINTSSIILEDCVHRLVDPEEIHLFHPNHVVMDSLRKDSPLPGGFLYGTHQFLAFPQGGRYISFYFVSSIFFFLLFRMIIIASTIFNLPTFTRFAHEIVLKKHDDIIGDTRIPQRGLPGVPFIHQFINFQKVKRKKEQQVTRYSNTLSSMLSHPPEQQPRDTFSFYSIPIPTSDYQHLHVYPLGIRGKLPSDILTYLHTQGIIVWTKFPDCPWSQTRHVLFLPLGFHVTNEDIQKTTGILAQIFHTRSGAAPLVV